MHDHDHRHVDDRRALAIALALIVAFLIAEVVAALIAGSLALLADAGHMLTDAGALAFALFAATLAARPAQGRWTFGYKRLEILAAQANGVTLLVVALLILFGSVRRLVSPSDVRGGIVLVVALGGIAVNVAATAVLSRASRESLNVRGAFLHVATDTVAFAGTAVAGALILATGWDRFDPIASLGVAALMLWASWGLLHESASIFLERSPVGNRPGRGRPRARRRAGGRRGARPARLDRDERLPSAGCARPGRSPRRTATRFAGVSSRCCTTGSGSSTRRCRSITPNRAC